jgi:hypothetical protein
MRVKAWQAIPLIIEIIFAEFNVFFWVHGFTSIAVNTPGQGEVGLYFDRCIIII